MGRLQLQDTVNPFKQFFPAMLNTTLKPATGFNMNCSAPGAVCGPPLWYQLPECAVAPYGFVFYFAVKVFNLALGTPSNILVIWHITTKKSNMSTSDIFILNLAALDAYFCVMTPIDIVNRTLLGDSCIWYFQRFAYGIKDLAPLFLVCICVDRYIAVVHPVLFTSIHDKMRFSILMVVWCFVLAYGLAKCTLGHASVTEVFSGVILFAFVVMVFCNIAIIWVLRRSVAGKEEMHPVKKKAFKMVLIILAIIVVNYLPPVALMPFVSYYSFVAFNCQISISLFSIMDLSCSVEPLLYITKMEREGGRCCGWKPHDVKV